MESRVPEGAVSAPEPKKGAVNFGHQCLSVLPHLSVAEHAEFRSVVLNKSGRYRTGSTRHWSDLAPVTTAAVDKCRLVRWPEDVEQLVLRPVFTATPLSGLHIVYVSLATT